MVKVYDFVESTKDTEFRCFSIGLKIYIVRFSLVICFIFVKVKNIIVASSTQVFCMKGHFSFTSSADLNLGLPFEFFVTRIT